MTKAMKRFIFSTVADVALVAVVLWLWWRCAMTKEYAVKASGHGSAFRFNNPLTPTLMSLKKAIAEATHWIGYADTIGGDAVVIHIPSNKQVWP